MTIRGFLTLLPLWLIAVFVSAQAAIRLPYIENWPYTWVVYGSLFGTIGLGLFIRCSVKKFTPDPLSFRGAGSIFLLTFPLLTAFLCFFVRSFVEPLHSSSFEYVEVLKKYRSSNHHYPAMQLRTEDGRSISLDLPGQEDLWQSVKVGDHLAKPFGDKKLVPVIRKRSGP